MQKGVARRERFRTIGTPYYRTGEALLHEGKDLGLAERYFRRYLTAEPEGNAPTLAAARANADQILARRKRSMRSANRADQVEDGPNR